jgi:hypothetical protein
LVKQLLNLDLNSNHTQISRSGKTVFFGGNFCTRKKVASGKKKVTHKASSTSGIQKVKNYLFFIEDGFFFVKVSFSAVNNI